MKTLYWVIVYRPEGLKTWTPLNILHEENPTGNFFASEATARTWLDVGLKPRHITSFRYSTQNEVENEFKIAKVVIDEPTQTID